MSITSTPSSTTPVKARRAPRYVLISAWAVPIMVLGEFSMLAIVPVVLLVVGAFRNVSLSALRLWVGILAAMYATPLAIWLLREDGAESLSKDMHPVFMTLIVVAACSLLIRIYTRKR